jgi:hypothetical protein
MSDYPEGQDEPRPTSDESFLAPDDAEGATEGEEPEGPPPGGSAAGLGVPPAAD